jgi:hypothetical protein
MWVHRKKSQSLDCRVVKNTPRNDSCWFAASQKTLLSNDMTVVRADGKISLRLRRDKKIVY